MKVFFCVALVAVISFVSARPDGSSEAKESEEEKMLQHFSDLLAKLEQSQDLAEDLEALRLYLALSVVGYELYKADQWKRCSDKFGVDETEALQSATLPANLPENVRNVLQCVGEEDELWKDGQPAGFLLLWKQYSDVVLEKYSDLNEDFTKLAQQGRECFTYEETDTGFASVLQCVHKLMSDD